MARPAKLCRINKEKGPRFGFEQAGSTESLILLGILPDDN